MASIDLDKAFVRFQKRYRKFENGRFGDTIIKPSKEIYKNNSNCIISKNRTSEA